MLDRFSESYTKRGAQDRAEKIPYISSDHSSMGAHVDTTQPWTGQLKNTIHTYRLVLSALSDVKV